MLKRLAIVVLVASVLPVYGQENGSQAGYDKHAPQAGKDPAPPLNNKAQCVIKEDGTAIDCEWPKSVPEGYLKRLAAPENAPNIALFVIGAIGVCVALATLVKIERQTKATEGTASTAIKDLAFSNRAYVGARIDKYMVEIGRPLNVSVIFENKGKTPAYKVRTCQVARLIRRGEETIISYPEERWSAGFSIIMPDGFTLRLGNAIGSDNDPRITLDGLLTRELYESIRSNEFAAVTYGQIQYEDIFGVPHWTVFCHAMRMMPPIQGIGETPAWGPSSVGNDMDKNQEQPSTKDQSPKRWWQFWRKATSNPN